MGRTEPCVLFAQTILHPKLDEYVDEVLFSEPVVVTACEFLEQNASPSTPNVSLIGATSPPSFALEVFAHSEGESRFRRLCQPFLYSHSSSNVLEVEAIVTNHLVLRGTYRSLTLVVYGNTAEDLGQFNIELDLDNSLANVVSSPLEGKLEDLPPALHLSKLTFEESVSSLKFLTFRAPEFELSNEVKHFLMLILKICQISDIEKMDSKVINSVMSVVSLYAMANIDIMLCCCDEDTSNGVFNSKLDSEKVLHALTDARDELLGIWEKLQPINLSSQLMEGEVTSGPETELPSAEMLVDMFDNCFPFFRRSTLLELQMLSQKKSLVLALGLVLLLCSSRESCFHFVSAGGMEQILRFVCQDVQESIAVTLLILGIIECATRHGIGCDAFLGWWPRVDGNVPIHKSDGYCFLLKLLLEKQRHDIAAPTTYVLHRLRCYELLSRYELAVVSLLDNLPAGISLCADGVSSLIAANSQLAQILKLINLWGPIDDPSTAASARRVFNSDHNEGLLSYKATINIIAKSKYSSMMPDIDPYLLSLFKEKGFFPLSAALLSSPVLRSASGSIADIFMDIAALLESILLSFLSCRSGFSFLLAQPEVTELIVLSFQDAEDKSLTECKTLRQSVVFLSKGFFCRPKEVGMITELHLKVGNAVDRLIEPGSSSDEILWVLWELCATSRSDSGRQALLSLSYFPEAVSVLLDLLRSYKDLDSAATTTGASPLGLAIFHSAAEIFEVLVTDSTASSLRSWVGLAEELHKALHSSSPGSNRKDAPTRLLEWIDAGVIYQRNGATGLLRYAAILASGGDAHLSSASVLVSDSIDVENVVADSTNSPDGQVVDNLLGKLVLDKYFDGVTLRSTSIVQLTTAFRILAFISEESAAAACLFEEGAISLAYVVVVNCNSMLQRLSNSYDYLVDEGAESSSTTDLLLDRTCEQAIADLLIPTLVLLINVLHKLRETKAHYRNKKLVNALLQLHREVSPKLAACATDLSLSYPSSAIAFGIICHLITSALAFWPVYGWSPGLFHCLLGNAQDATTLLPLGPKDACSMLCLLGDLFPDEGIWLWRNKIPPLTAVRALSIGTVFGPQAETEINWYLYPEHPSVLLVRLMPQLDRIAQVVLNFATSALMVIQDMLRVFIVRIAYLRTECAIVLLRPIFSWLNKKVDETSLQDMDILKVHQLLHFIAGLSEHPVAKGLLCKMGAVKLIAKALERCSNATYSEGRLILGSRVPFTKAISHSWRIPIFKSLALIFSTQSSTKQVKMDECLNEHVDSEQCSLITCHILKLFEDLPVGKELLACALALKELLSSHQCRSSLALICSQSRTSNREEQEQDFSDTDHNVSIQYDWRQSSPFLKCLKKLLRSRDSNECSADFTVRTIHALSLGAIQLASHDHSLDGTTILKCLFGLPCDMDDSSDPSEILNEIVSMIKTLEQMMKKGENFTASFGKSTLDQVKVTMISMLSLLQNTSDTLYNSKDSVFNNGLEAPSDVVRSVVMTAHLMPSLVMLSENGEASLFSSSAWMFIEEAERAGTDSLDGGFPEKFVWELPDSSIDRQIMPALSARRKLALGEGSGRRMRDNLGSEAVSPFSRGVNASNVPAGPTRRDTFRQRKPNTSRPPSMHVDDYVARERNTDAASSGSNIVSSIQRGGSIGGRPPSIHVDEFMARQRERLNSIAIAVGDAPQVKNSTVSNDNDNDAAKLDKSQQLKADLDDDQEIDIVFDEESGSDDKLPFPQPDDNLETPPVVIGENSPGSVVEENEGDQSQRSRLPQIGVAQVMEDGIMNADIASKLSVLKSETLMGQAPNGFLNKKFTATSTWETPFHDQSEELKHASSIARSRGREVQPTANAYSSPFLINPSCLPSAGQPMPPPNFYQRKSMQNIADSSSTSGPPPYGEHKLSSNQPPLPPVPPPIATLVAHNADSMQSHSSAYDMGLKDGPPPLPTGRPPQSFDFGMANPLFRLQFQPDNMLLTGSSSSSNTLLNSESKFPWSSIMGSRLPMENFGSGTSARPPSPVPPPYSAPITHLSAMNSGSPASLYSHTVNLGTQASPSSALINDASFGIIPTSGSLLSSYSLNPFTPSLLINRPSMSGSAFTLPLPQQGQLSSNIPQLLPNSQPSLQPTQPRPPPPPPPPQVPHPSQPPQLTTPIHLSQPHPEPSLSFPQSSVQAQVPLRIPQHLPVHQVQSFYQSQQQEPISQLARPVVDQVQPQNQTLQADGLSQQKDSGMTLQQYFSSPEAIQSLLSDRDKLCQLLEQHPKLMQMLQERLGQL